MLNHIDRNYALIYLLEFQEIVESHLYNICFRIFYKSILHTFVIFLKQFRLLEKYRITKMRRNSQ